jgi:hypothetical protein
LKSRFTKLGIKQTIQLSWMDKVVKMLLSDMSQKDIRQDLDEFLCTQKQSGGIGERGKDAYIMAISILACWFAPAEDLLNFRDKLLEQAKVLPQKQWIVLHWAIISVTYPFWFNVARQAGRLFNLQDQITQPQIFNRLKEQYGDRETVVRNARYAVRSMVAWGVIEDTAVKGRYREVIKPAELDELQTVLLIEAGLRANPEGKMALANLLSEPAFFPFKLHPVSGVRISQYSNDIDVIRYGMTEDLLKLK